MTADEQKQFDAVIADRDHWKAEHLKQQQGWDAALQKVKDQAAEHAAELQRLRDGQAAELARVESGAAAALKEQAVRHADALAAQATALGQQHAADKAKLINEVLIPAQNDHQARLRSDFEAKMKADREALLAQLN